MSDVVKPTFRVALTADFYDDAGELKFADIGLDVFRDQAGIQVSRLSEHRPEIDAVQLVGCQGVIVLTPRVTAETLGDAHNFLAIGRFGVGFDNVDVDACTKHDVLAMITAGAVDRPVAEATVGWMLALSHHIFDKDRLVRSGKWNDRSQYMGCELRDRTLGVIGLGGIGKALVGLLKSFGMRPPIAYDPFASAESFQQAGVRSVDLDELLRTADFVSLHCPLNDKTRGLIGSRELSLMKRDAYLLNTARGGIVDEAALFDALASRRIAGAAIDCYENEPVDDRHRFCTLPNVILAPHSIAWTNELFRDIGRTACQSMLDLAVGRRPVGVLNPQLFESESFRAKWARLIGQSNPAALPR
jgi:phosphoglycerate dehydrogenase-like enzyme